MDVYKFANTTIEVLTDKELSQCQEKTTPRVTIRDEDGIPGYESIDAAIESQENIIHSFVDQPSNDKSDQEMLAFAKSRLEALKAVQAGDVKVSHKSAF